MFVQQCVCYFRPHLILCSLSLCCCCICSRLSATTLSEQKSLYRFIQSCVLTGTYLRLVASVCIICSYLYVSRCICVCKPACPDRKLCRKSVDGNILLLDCLTLLPSATHCLLFAGKYCCKPWLHGVHCGMDHASRHHFWLPLHA